MLLRLFIAGSVLLMVSLLGLWWVDRGTMPVHSSAHSSHGTTAHLSASPVESGQSAFAALIEIVDLLERDSDTDWKQVNIDQLRTHLRDMSRLVLDTEARTTIISSGQIRFDIQGSEMSAPAIHRMVPAHASYIRQSRGWTIETKSIANGASVTISVDDTATLEVLSALGFYGFMSLDSHHQAHHLLMAMGQEH